MLCECWVLNDCKNLLQNEFLIKLLKLKLAELKLKSAKPWLKAEIVRANMF